MRNHPGVIYILVVSLLSPFLYFGLFWLRFESEIHPLYLQILGNMWFFAYWYGVFYYHARWLDKHCGKYFTSHPLEDCPSFTDCARCLRGKLKFSVMPRIAK